jgi:hypothetical protein
MQNLLPVLQKKPAVPVPGGVQGLQRPEPPLRTVRKLRLLRQWDKLLQQLLR